ncbi:MAG: glycosyltransferase family 2 protein [Deltaproteobacteria bacterium]|nr:glycosyltransferase family 2 protein [Deltaproteobacteria bacterium]
MFFRVKARSDNTDISNIKVTIGITTFEHRFEKYFVPLLSRIREYDQETEVIVAVNGEHEKEFSEDYRAGILRFISGQRKVFPLMFPRFRGLSKLWNSIIVHATSNHILMLNDDIMITDRKFLGVIRRCIARNEGRSFTINESWSHYLISREEIDRLGYFDERLLGIGEEDGDITWRYMNAFERPIANFRIKGLKNFAEETVHNYRPSNIQCHSGTKYSLFNKKFIAKKYRPDTAGIRGMFEHPMSLVDPGPDQYPNEKFYRTNKEKL